MSWASGTQIEQGYLAIDPAGAEVRVRRKGAKTVMTVKTGRGMVRGEEEFEIATDRFERLWALTRGAAGEQDAPRRRSLGSLTVEVDVYEGALHGPAWTAEVEFPETRRRRARSTRRRGSGPGRHRRRALCEPRARGERDPVSARIPAQGRPNPNTGASMRRLTLTAILLLAIAAPAYAGYGGATTVKTTHGKLGTFLVGPKGRRCTCSLGRQEHQSHLLRRLRHGLAAAAHQRQAEGLPARPKASLLGTDQAQHVTASAGDLQGRTRSIYFIQDKKAGDTKGQDINGFARFVCRRG